jgi:hypothetical protein
LNSEASTVFVEKPPLHLSIHTSCNYNVSSV